MHLYDAILITPALQDNAVTASANGADHNLAPSGGAAYQQAMFYFDVGLRTDGTHTFKIQEAPDNGSGAPGTYADVPAARVLGGNASGQIVIDDATDDDQQYFLGVLPSAAGRFLRVAVTVAGATTGLADVEVHAVLGAPDDLPVR